MDKSGTSYVYLADGIPKDITILKTNTTIVYADGGRADVSNGVYNHHAFMGDVKRPLSEWYSCGGTGFNNSNMLNNPANGGSLFIGGSEDKYGAYFTTPQGDVKSGYYVGRKDQLMMNIDFIKYNNETKQVYTLNNS